MATTFEPKQIRNVAIVGHTHSGKTALAEAILFDDGATTRLGHAGDATSTLDTEPEEIRRGGSILSHFGWVEHRGRKINFIDTPGDQNFFWDGLTALLGADGVVVTVSAADGVRLQTRRAWAAATERHLPRIIVVNQMDRATKKWPDVVREISQALHIQALPLQLPLGEGEAFVGIVDLLAQRAYRWTGDASGKVKEEEIPPPLQDEARQRLAELTEGIVSTNDALLEKYLETNDVSLNDLRAALHKALSRNDIVPLLFVSATRNVGIQPLLDLIAQGLPSPIDRGPVVCRTPDGMEQECSHRPEDRFLAQVLHTAVDDHVGQVSILRIFSGTLPKEGEVLNASTGERLRLGAPYLVRGREYTKIPEVVCGDIVSAIKLRNTHTNNTLCDPASVRLMPGMEYPKPMISYVLQPATKKDDDKLKEAVERMIEEDPTLSYSHDELSHQMVLHGLGHGHLETAIERLGRKYHVTVKKDFPLIPYRETLAGRASMAEGKHKKQTGGAGQFGICYIDAEPLPRGAGFEFVNDIKGGVIPRQFIPSVEKGVVERAKHGLTAGYPLIDFRVSLKDGKHHPVDSKDIAFQMAGWKALRVAMEHTKTKLLEPFYKLEIVVPTENSGAVMSDISTRRGHVDGMENRSEMAVIHASCPLAEVQRYVADLHSMTSGQGSFTMAFDAYKEVPPHLAERIRQASPFLKDAAKEEE